MHSVLTTTYSIYTSLVSTCTVCVYKYIELNMHQDVKIKSSKKVHDYVHVCIAKSVDTSLSVHMYYTARMYQCCFALCPTYFHVSYIDKCIMMYLSVNLSKKI